MTEWKGTENSYRIFASTYIVFTSKSDTSLFIMSRYISGHDLNSVAGRWVLQGRLLPGLLQATPQEQI